MNLVRFVTRLRSKGLNLIRCQPNQIHDFQTAPRSPELGARVTEPALAAFSRGALLAPDHAVVLGPDIDTWLETLASDRGSRAAAVGGTDGLTEPSPTP